MTLAKDNERVLITLPRAIHEAGKELAKADNRTFSNYVATLIARELERSLDRRRGRKGKASKQ